jgi:glycosyltransferase involved in cell wall biosynthesis
MMEHDNRMRTLIVNTLYRPHRVGGAERSVEILAETLAARGVEVHVLTTAPKPCQREYANVMVHYWKTPNLWWSFDSHSRPKVLKPIWHLLDSSNPLIDSRFLALLSDLKPDLVHTNNLSGFSPRVWKLARSAGLPVVHTTRDMYLLCVKSSMFRRGRACERSCTACKVFSELKRSYEKHVDAAVGISNFILKRHLDAGYFTEARLTRRIFNPVHKPSGARRESSTEDGIRVGFVGSISPHKGIELLLKAMGKDQSRSLSLKVFGRANQTDYIGKLTKRYRSARVSFEGFEPPDRIYPEIDLLVVPSLWHEPFGRVVIEANSFGVPAIVSNRGGLPEIVTEGENGAVFDPDRPGDLYRAIDTLVKSGRLPDSVRDRSRASAARYSADLIADQYLDLYTKVLQ